MKRPITRVYLYVFALLITVSLISPIAWLIISSISHKTELASIPPHWIPQKPTLVNYQILLFGKETTALVGGTQEFLPALINTIVICTGTAAIALAFGLPVSYGLSRFRFKGRHIIRMAVISIRMIPFGSMIIPFYLMLSKAHLLDTKIGLIVVYQSFTLPFVIWIMSSYFASIPIDIEESARVEGARAFTIFRRIALPICLPGLATTAIIAYMISWDEMFYALILTNSNRAKTLSVAITELSTRYTIDFSLWITGGVIGLVFPFLLAAFFQKYLVRGLTMGAIKG